MTNPETEFLAVLAAERAAQAVPVPELSGEVTQQPEGSMHALSLHPDHAIAGVAVASGHDVGGHLGLAAGISN
jgi:hypothetical protein